MSKKTKKAKEPPEPQPPGKSGETKGRRLFGALMFLCGLVVGGGAATHLIIFRKDWSDWWEFTNTQWALMGFIAAGILLAYVLVLRLPRYGVRKGKENKELKKQLSDVATVLQQLQDGTLAIGALPAAAPQPAPLAPRSQPAPPVTVVSPPRPAPASSPKPPPPRVVTRPAPPPSARPDPPTSTPATSRQLKSTMGSERPKIGDSRPAPPVTIVPDPPAGGNEDVTGASGNGSSAHQADPAPATSWDPHLEDADDDFDVPSFLK